MITANDHLRGGGCPMCTAKGFRLDQPGILYYLRIETGSEPLYKIGVTNRSVNLRFSKSERKRITVIQEMEFEDGEECWALEQYWLMTYKQFQYTGEPFLERGGNTELFTRDVLGLDKDYA
jgi:hypothetical protein